MKTADQILNEAAQIIKERAASRDTENERSMERTVNAFNAIYGTNLTTVQGWDFMSILKKVRGSQGQFREDDYTDDVSYVALKAEAACEEHHKRTHAQLLGVK